MWDLLLAEATAKRVYQVEQYVELETRTNSFIDLPASNTDPSDRDTVASGARPRYSAVKTRSIRFHRRKAGSDKADASS